MGGRVLRACSCAVLLALIALEACTAALAASPVGVAGSGVDAQSSLVIESAGWLLGDAQLSAQREAARTSPGAVAARRLSRLRFQRLGAGAAAKLASESYPGLVDQLDGGQPQLAPGERIAGYPSDYSARLDLASGKHALIQSLAPIALETSRGPPAPADLSPGQSGGAFQPVRSASAVRIPKRLGEGVR